MARRRFYAPPDLIEGTIVTLSADETHHLINVLRMTPGDSAFVFDGRGNEYNCRFRGLKTNLAQPMFRIILNRRPRLAAKQQRHGGILQGRKFGKQVMKLPYEPDFTIAKIRGGIIRQRIQLQVGAVYVTVGSTFKGAQDVQQGTLAGS
jgi:hypothetical protein